jgi:hypothetical protein
MLYELQRMLAWSKTMISETLGRCSLPGRHSHQARGPSYTHQTRGPDAIAQSDHFGTMKGSAPFKHPTSFQALPVQATKEATRN